MSFKITAESDLWESRGTFTLAPASEVAGGHGLPNGMVCPPACTTPFRQNGQPKLCQYAHHTGPILKFTKKS
jgi:hypothetical protein